MMEMIIELTFTDHLCVIDDGDYDDDAAAETDAKVCPQ